MNLVASLTSGVISSVVDSVGNVVDRFIETDDERSQFKLALEETLQKRDSEVEQTIRAELQAKERVMVAEMAQGDNYTKRARPTVIYFGLLVIAFNYCLIPMVQLIQGLEITPFMLPEEFWYAWGGAISVYSLGRSMEKRGIRNRFTKTAHGQSELSLLD